MRADSSVGAAGPSAGATPQVSFRALGTTASLLVDCPAALERGRALLEEELAAIDLACSRFRPDSELTRVNHAPGRPVRISALLTQALAVALEAAAATDGDVDPTCGGALIDLGYDRDFAAVASGDARGGKHGVVTARAIPGWRKVELDRRENLVRVPSGVVLDLGATAKALAADRAAARIHAAVGCGVLVNLGGDIAVAGQAPDGGWRVRVIDDEDAAGRVPQQAVAVTVGGLATSSTGVRVWRRGPENVHHIVSPATGRSAEPYWQTVTVAGDTCVAANIASTAAIVRGPGAVAWLEALGMPARLVRPDGATTYTGPWPRPDAATGNGS
ncbi:MAG TPA: FAD:protein FMN transferase [Actinocrinis sp.]|jgi:thiamine biosynthesis lipoprotein|uniref:FAD:protein FMN transferase n=1 Tax=Actinocrinis sp. TaxID=1920516 RepID=UPI002DDD8F40|nr:FAD:protein FMN transferase [Actinocrinis sp.]HEV3169641.1 FAD:protein FMN transferase [Actinocrinis sp.]